MTGDTVLAAQFSVKGCLVQAGLPVSDPKLLLIGSHQFGKLEVRSAKHGQLIRWAHQTARGQSDIISL